MKTSTSPWEIKNCTWAKWVLEKKETNKQKKAKVNSESWVHGAMLILIKVTQKMSVCERTKLDQ